jgi:class 3 adenylate cyclase
MSDLRDWLAQYGSKDWNQKLDDIPLDFADFDDLSDEELARHGVSEPVIEYLRRSVRQLRASKQLLTRPQHRQVTVLFVDLVGSTALGQRLGDELAIPLKNTFRRISRRAVEEFGGNVMYSHHDELVACFGFPIARERDAERAVRAALKINKSLLQARASERLQVRVGVSTARSIVGAVDPDSPEMINAGMVVSHAARLSETADPGQIRISETTHALTGDVAVATYCGEQHLNGFTTAQGSWSVISLAREASSIPLQTVTPMVGREAEMARLTERWEHCRTASQMQVFCILGDAGIGKSRLMQELRYQLPMAQSASLFVCSPYHTHSALYPISQQLAWTLGLSEESTDEERCSAVDGLLSAIDTRIEHASAQLCLLLGSSIATEHPINKVPADLRKKQLFELLRDIVFYQVAEAPLLAIIEDVQWIDPTTLQLIRYLNEQASDRRYMVLLTARTGLVLPDFVAEDNAIELTPLSPTSCSQLVRAVDTSTALPDPVIASIVEQCDGVPMFVEEVTRAHLTTGLSAEDQTMTPRLNDLLIANLDSVGEARSTAQLASVIGKRFSIAVLEAVSSLPNELLHKHVTTLRDKGLFLERLEPDHTLSFRHSLLRDCAYETLLAGEKVACHGLVADALIAAGNTPDEILARHLREAGRQQDSIIRWQEAAHTATRNGAYLEATAHLEAALAMLPANPDPTDKASRRTRQELLLRMLPALLGSVSYGSRRVQQTMDDAISLSHEIGVDSRIFPFFYGRWINTQAVGKHKAALAYSEEFIKLAQLHGDAGATTASHINAAWSAFNLAQLTRAKDLLEQAEQASCSIRRHGVGFAYAADGIIGLESCRVQTLWCLGDIDGCRQASARALSRSQKVTNGQSIFLATQYAGAMTHALLREWDTVLRYGREMMNMEKIAGAAATGQFYSALAEMHIEKNNLQFDAARNAEQTISRMGFKYLMPFWQTCLAEAALEFGDDVTLARELLDSAEQIVDETGERWFWVEHMRLRALTKLRGEQSTADACDLFQQACQLAVEQQSYSFGLRSARAALDTSNEPRFQQHCQHFESLLQNGSSPG